MTRPDVDSVAVGRPAVSVVVIVPSTVPVAAETLERCLASVVSQTLPAGRRELLVVRTDLGPGEAALPGSPPTGGDIGALRELRVPGASTATARDVAVSACRGDAVVFLEPWQVASRGLLAWLVDHADATSLPAARHTGSGTAAPALLRCATSGVLAPRDLWASHPCDEHAAEGAGAHQLLRVTAAPEREVVEAGPDDDAVLSTGPAFAWRTPLDALAGVLRLKVDGPDARRRRRASLEAAAGRLREVLVARPELQEDVVREVRRRRLVRMPWDLVNRGRARQLGLLYCFPPAIDTSGLVAARRLEQLGAVTDVVSQDLSNQRPVAADSLRVAAPYVDELCTLPGARAFDTWESVLGWTTAALARVRELEARKGDYEQVYSRSMSLQSHVAAAVVKLRRPGVRWIAEFSDPMLHDDAGGTREQRVGHDWLSEELERGMRDLGHALPAERRMYEWAELLPYALADEIIFTNNHQREVMLGYCRDVRLAHRARRVSRADHHPVPAPELYRLSSARVPLDQGKVHLGYFGTFYASRGLPEVVGALRSLTPEERGRVELHVFTNRPSVELEVIEHGLADVMTVRPMRSYLDYLHLTTLFDVLLVNDYATAAHTVPNPYLPAKLAEYVGSGRPVWAVVEPGSVLSGIKTAHRSELGDVDGALAVLRRLVRPPRKAGYLGV